MRKKISKKAELERKKLAEKKIPETKIAFEFQSGEDFKIVLDIMFKEKPDAQFSLAEINNIIVNKKDTQRYLEKRLKQLQVEYKLTRVSPAGNLSPKEFNRIRNETG